MSVKRKLLWLIGLATVIRIIAAISIDLGNDEVYYLTYARHLQWNYFDHPPMVALMIRLTTFNLHFTNEFFVRLGPIVLSGINTLLLFKLAGRLKNEHAGFIAALLFTASPYCSIIGGIFIMPDGPQIFFWIISIYILVDIVLKNSTKAEINKKLLLFGVSAGLCTMSKIHGIFLWIGFISYVLLYAPKFLSNIYLYLSAATTAVIISPILIWNIQNNFITYNFHSSRITPNHEIHLLSFLRESIGGMLYNNPICYFLLIIALFLINKGSPSIDRKVKNLLLLLGFPLILIILFTSLFRDTLPHWSGPGYIPLIILAACKLEVPKAVSLRQPTYLKLAYCANLVLAFTILLGILMVNFYPGTIGKQKNDKYGNGDFTLDIYGWKKLRYQFEEVREMNAALGISKTTFIISDKWFPAAHIDNYVAQPLQLNFLALGNINDIHTYAWINQYRKMIEKGNDAYFITFSNNFSDPHIAFNNLFKEISTPVIITQNRNGKLARNVLIYLLKDYKGK
ncbi:4-amino-4-deoxy-L-arabinose transferase-like glycosyltransferase [Pedobacter sp. UYP24]